MKDRVGFAFFGTSHIAVYVLDELEKVGLTPSLLVTTPDRPRGRGMEMATSAVKQWANVHGVEVLQPEDLGHSHILQNMRMLSPDVSVVVDYGKILPKELLEIPKRGFLNVHPSLLPRLRGASPIRSAILTDEKNTGVTIMLVDEKMDHGPIVAQKKIIVNQWPPHLYEFERLLMSEGGKLLAQVMPLWLREEIEAHEQNHDLATYCEKISKDDGLLDVKDNAYKNLLKIRAYEGWPGTFAYFEKPSTGSTSSGQENKKRIRVKILDAHIKNDELVIDRVVPEGKREMSYKEFLNSGAQPM